MCSSRLAQHSETTTPVHIPILCWMYINQLGTNHFYFSFLLIGLVWFWMTGKWSNILYRPYFCLLSDYYSKRHETWPQWECEALGNKAPPTLRNFKWKFVFILSMEIWASEKKPTSFKLVWRYHQFLSGFLANGHLPRASHQSRLSANDKDDNTAVILIARCLNYIRYVLYKECHIVNDNNKIE